MDFENIVAVSGKPGLFKLVNTRSNGLVVEDMDHGKRLFVSMRKHQFTPLESVGIYTYSDVSDIKAVFKAMLRLRDEQPLPSASASPTEIHAYFRKVLPDYDEDRVYLSDIKKMIKWFRFLDERGMITLSDDEEE